MKFIFEVRIREGYRAEDYADAWVRASELIQQAPGARGMAHQRAHRPAAVQVGGDEVAAEIAGGAGDENGGHGGLRIGVSRFIVTGRSVI